jgi:hypothetical protein
MAREPRHFWFAMKLTIIQTGEVPAPLRDRFVPYPNMFHRMFEQAGHDFSYETAAVFDGAPFPDPDALEGIIITGSPAGVYDNHLPMDGAAACLHPQAPMQRKPRCSASALAIRSWPMRWAAMSASPRRAGALAAMSTASAIARNSSADAARIRHRLLASGPGHRAARRGRGVPQF